MLTDHYYVRYADDFLTFEFVSEGPKGQVEKVVVYTEINIKGFYNIGFGDKDPVTGFLSDMVVTNNSDSQKVLATVATTLNVFTQKYPDAVIIAAGTTEARTRLYRMGIANNLENIEKEYIVLGLTEKGWEVFKKRTEYGAFSIQRKNVNL